MSAWVVEKMHIDILLHLGQKHGQVDPGDATLMGQSLWLENVRSVNYRYAHDQEGQVDEDTARAYVAPRAPLRLTLTTAAALKAVDCYEYQSDNHPGWEGSDAWRFCRGLRAEILRTMPGYDAAPWGWGADLYRIYQNPVDQCALAAVQA